MKTSKEKFKVCFAASAGGHWEQIINLSILLDEFDGFFVTEKTPVDVGAEGKKIYYLKHVNRHQWSFLWKIVENSWLSLKILLKEKPSVVITTGCEL